MVVWQRGDIKLISIALCAVFIFALYSFLCVVFSAMASEAQPKPKVEFHQCMRCDGRVRAHPATNMCCDCWCQDSIDYGKVAIFVTFHALSCIVLTCRVWYQIVIRYMNQ